MGVVACASAPRARRLTRHRAGHEPTIYVASRRGDRADYRRPPSFACARLSRRLGLISRSRRSMSRAPPQAWSLARQCQVHGASRVIVLAMSQRDRVASRRGAEPAIADRRHSRARVCRADTGPVFSRSRRWLSPRRHLRDRLRVSAKCTAPHASSRWPRASAIMSRLAAGAEPTFVGRCRSRARVCRADSGLVFSRPRRWLSCAPPRALSLACRCQVLGTSRVIALAMSRRGYVASRSGGSADPRRPLSLTCARLSHQLGSCDLTVAPVDVSRSPQAWSLARQCQV